MHHIMMHFELVGRIFSKGWTVYQIEVCNVCFEMIKTYKLTSNSSFIYSNCSVYLPLSKKWNWNYLIIHISSITSWHFIAYIEILVKEGNWKKALIFLLHMFFLLISNCLYYVLHIWVQRTPMETSHRGILGFKILLAHPVFTCT